MFELISSMALALVMVPIVMAMILGLIYGLGEVFNIISKSETKKS
ncbi:AcrZ family multidrug efflux pump-associated protein [Xenorhabdus hominickii]|uniref:Multidrug efflux pump accessory protein AcrZ n=1 Tax=Xenorhabdus hominickii TaxID=351679 RepID=A0A2G0QAR1_XENHO|nr:AcrZ family multidrug efflux pump-associated protein [Xenorhabdus hominickii]PHM56249.1 Multidrug efflux pump accessory protein AcrZ [Xenorhabdus hominickii]